MTVGEYLKDFEESIEATFIKARSRKDSHTPFYHAEYQTTPIRTIREWKESELMDYHILNNKQCPIDWLSGASWGNAFKRGELLSLLVIRDEDLKLLYSVNQAAGLIEYIGKKIAER